MARLERKRSSYKSFKGEDEVAEDDVGEGTEWEQHVDDATGAPYWHNWRTNETSWEPPPGFATLPPGWEQLIDDESGQPYWHNHTTGATSWSPPSHV